MLLSVIKKDISTKNRKIGDLIKYKLTEDDVRKYNVDSDLYIKSGHISLRSARQVIFWIQDSGYKHTSTHEELKQIFTLVSDFNKKYEQLDINIRNLQNELSLMKAEDLQKDASPALEDLYLHIKQQYSDLESLRETLIIESLNIKNQTILRPEELATSPDEPVGNEEALITLFRYFKEDLQKQLETSTSSKELLLNKKPQELLINFLEAVLNDDTNKFSALVKDHVENIIYDLGGKIMIPEVFNTDSSKKFGVLKTPKAKELLKEIGDLITSYKSSSETNQRLSTTEQIKSFIKSNREDITNDPDTKHTP